MITQAHKDHIQIWWPVLKELELMGYNPVRLIFGTFYKLWTIEIWEDVYVAYNRAKGKYPEWYKAIRERKAKR